MDYLPHEVALGWAANSMYSYTAPSFSMNTTVRPGIASNGPSTTFSPAMATFDQRAREHIQALAIEALMANFLGVNWRVYEARLASLE